MLWFEDLDPRVRRRSWISPVEMSGSAMVSGWVVVGDWDPEGICGWKGWGSNLV